MLIIHADDFGASRAITDRILACHDEGRLDSTSVIPTGRAFDHAVGEKLKRPNLRLAIHLNLVEGRPLSPPSEIPLLVDGRGEFRLGFTGFWRLDRRFGRMGRADLRDQIKAELRRQIRRVAAALGADLPLYLDSHMHTHMTPPVFACLTELAAEFRFAYVRLPAEPFFWHLARPGDLRNYLGPNIAKHLLLNRLARRRRPVLGRLGIAANDYFIGVLYTGRMTAAALRAGLAAIGGRAGDTRGRDDAVVEALFHPGGAAPGEEAFFGSRKSLIEAYYSPNRNAEYQELLSPEMARIIAQYRGGWNARPSPASHHG
ncbi:MAG: ChbG/HpnK family deacetylase [bacterium]|nr:ChbG/HpnK family deacetylase [bacterium]